MITIQKIEPKNLIDFQKLISVFEIVFEMKNFKSPEPLHLQKLLEYENFIPIVAKQDDLIIGGLTIYILEQYYSVKPLAYLYDLAVLQEHQRQGIGRSLINFARTYCKEQGFEELFVQADKADDYALEFYRSTNPTEEEDVSHFYYKLV
jgi:aminoglycoside 3-N-acetyltransferase I